MNTINCKLQYFRSNSHFAISATPSVATNLIKIVTTEIATRQSRSQSRSQSMPVRGLCSGMPLHNPRTGILWERDWQHVNHDRKLSRIFPHLTFRAFDSTGRFCDEHVLLY
jgi:hypothetical protein